MFIADGNKIWQVRVIYPIKTGLRAIQVKCTYADMSSGWWVWWTGGWLF